MDSLIKIFDPVYKLEEDVYTAKNLGVLKEPQAKKRKRSEVPRNILGI